VYGRDRLERDQQDEGRKERFLRVKRKEACFTHAYEDSIMKSSKHFERGRRGGIAIEWGR
jgi:hypothetical protein